MPTLFARKICIPRICPRALEDGGTITSALVPWSTDAVFVYSALGVGAWTYAPYAILNYSVPIISILMALSGVAIVYQRDGDADTNTNADTAKP
jgi:NhaC family Na+:H+ antiporter